jgi:hypothetical protein
VTRSSTTTSSRRPTPPARACPTGGALVPVDQSFAGLRFPLRQLLRSCVWPERPARRGRHRQWPGRSRRWRGCPR